MAYFILLKKEVASNVKDITIIIVIVSKFSFVSKISVP
jgi:hypothetical protein